MKRDFIDLLANAGNVSKVCMALNVSRNRMYDAARRSPKFKAQWDTAMETAKTLLEDEAWRRAFDGVEKPVIYKGEQALDKDGNPLFIKEYSDHLMTVLLNGNFPEKYRYNSKVDHNVSGELSIKIVKFAADDGNNNTK